MPITAIMKKIVATACTDFPRFFKKRARLLLLVIRERRRRRILFLGPRRVGFPRQKEK